MIKCKKRKSEGAFLDPLLFWLLSLRNTQIRSFFLLFPPEFLRSTQRSRPTYLAMGPSGTEFGDFPTCDVGVAGSISERTNCKRAWIGPRIHLHGFFAQPECPGAKLVA